MLFCVKVGNSDKYLFLATRLWIVKLYDNKKVKSPYNWFISPLTQPEEANQQQQQKSISKRGTPFTPFPTPLPPRFGHLLICRWLGLTMSCLPKLFRFMYKVARSIIIKWASLAAK